MAKGFQTISVLLWISAVWAFGAEEAGRPEAQRNLSVDAEGVLRCRDTQQEAALFGVNYCLPSGYSFRAVGYVGADRKKTVEADMAHLARLGLDGLRLSFWGDWENSDRQGNLIDNEHLDLLDSVIAQAEKRGISILLTPITLYSPVWPEPEEMNTCQGFPRFFPKRELGINPEAIAVQQRYLSQIVQHVNRYTGRAYKDEPAIVMMEPVNEPHHHPGQKPVEYINALIQAIRDAGWNKPIVFNVSQDMAIAPAVRDSRADGAAFGWYPTGLVSGFTLRSNFLPRVESYRLLFDPALKNKPKVVYEFDTADVAGSYLYPAIARTFRSGGAQFAAMFTYDPLPLASRNLEYQTHCLNLVYTPGKAVSLLIAAEAFRRLPRGFTASESNRFGPVRVSFEEDLSELVTEREFFYSNTTRTVPPKPEQLERIIGCGSSPVLEYEGTGAYFLEKQAEGLWRLEVYPDVVWLRDPFGRPSRGRQAAFLVWGARRMKIAVPDLGTSFMYEGANEGNSLAGRAAQGTLEIQPGVYCLRRDPSILMAKDFSREYVVPARQKNPVVIHHLSPRQIAEGRPFAVRVRGVWEQPPQEVVCWVRKQAGAEFEKIPMKPVSRFDYETPIEGKAGQTIEYAVSVIQDGQTLTFPARIVGPPNSSIKAEAEPLVLFDAAAASQTPDLKQWSARQASVSLPEEGGRRRLRVQTAGFESNGAVSIDLALKSPTPSADSAVFEKEYYEDAILVFKGRPLSEQTDQLELVLIDRYGMQDKRLLRLDGRKGRTEILLKDVCLANLKTARLTFGAWLFPGAEGLAHGFELEEIAVRPSPRLWRVPVVAAESEFGLFEASADSDRLIFPNSEHRVSFLRRLTRGMAADRAALRVDVPTFRPAPQDVSFRLILDERIEPRREDLNQMDAVRVRVRAGLPRTRQMELLFIGRDGWVRGVRIPLTGDWKEHEIPLSRLEPMTASWLPRPYPTVGLDYWDQPDRSSGGLVDWSRLEAVQVSFGARLFPEAVNEPHALEIEEILLVRSSRQEQ
ncbi:MAG TPA: cellulase family glycosylhydrolase [Anaerohalosphaeraceae bacterium]|nr:cellulase family glycosylhydrolase [Anaerohalosphaeraceae bacterium]HOL87631.1 cellulase family glycosylhydrolase [Anaerohalosphaeraceae bacterium]HPP55862.1 cellulase family glycosylhydrolase [Anaerohalosphaeraceae bacterium]